MTDPPPLLLCRGPLKGGETSQAEGSPPTAALPVRSQGHRSFAVSFCAFPR